MVKSQKDRFKTRDIELSEFARSLGHPVRILILRAMGDQKILDSNSIKSFPMAPSTVIQHLRDLKKAGLVKGKIFGENARFYLDEQRFEELQKHWIQFSEKVAGNGREKPKQ